MNVLTLPAALASLAIHSHVAAAKGPDFDGDGFSELAIGIPDEDVNGEGNAGAVQVLYGSSNGLSSNGDQFWHQNQGLADSAEGSDNFGSALAWGDFNDDGFDDLAIGVPIEDVGSVEDAGAVQILYGSPSGLDNAGNQFWTQNSPGIADNPEDFDNFGSALAAGDFNNDGFDDLAIGVPDEDIGAIASAGAVHIIYGSSNGLDASGDQFFHQDTPGVQDAAGAGDNFGFALAAGDFNNDNRDDLAIGVPDEAAGGVNDAGAVHILYGSNAGLKTTNDQFWHQDVPGIADMAETNDNFGNSLAAGNFDGDGKDDLAIGIENEDVGAVASAGAVHILYGSGTGLSTAGDQFLHQDSPGIKGTAQASDNFGTDLIAGDFDGDARDDLAVGVDDEDVDGLDEAGAVAIIYGSNSGLTDEGNQLLHQNTTGVNDVAEEFDNFAGEVTAGDYDGDGRDDLAVAAEDESVPLASGQDISKITVQLSFFSHNHPNDVDVLLVGPDGDNIRLMSDVGGDTAVVDQLFNFDDDASASLPNGPMSGGTFKPTNNGSSDSFPVPAPAPSNATQLSIFNGTSPVGEWKLFVFDDFPTDDGGDIELWSLDLEGIGKYFNSVAITIPSSGGAGQATPYPLSITVPNDAIREAGAVHILYGSSGGITTNGDQLFHQNKSGIDNNAEPSDKFGAAL